MNAHGHTLDLAATVVDRGSTELRFRILGPDGRPVTAYTPVHDRELHLIVVRRELSGFWHLHPVRDAGGVWSVRLDLPDAGAYRVFADVAPRALGRTITLGADLAVRGPDEPDAPPEPDAPDAPPEPRTRFAAGGYEIDLAGELAAGEGRALTLTVRKDGAPVTDLEPYLGAYGHLVVLRAGDLAYVHVHPDGEPGDGATEPGPAVRFHAAVPGPGLYRLFLDFKHGGTVRTADFTLVAPPPDAR